MIIVSERDPMKDEEVKRIVREGYAKVAQQEFSCCDPGSSCCGGPALAEDISKKIGYSEDDMESVPEGANLGLGCGNPVALATIEEGETVVDLGSGAGFDAFLAAPRVGDTGRVIGVDMTPEMLEKARANAAKAGYSNVEFRLGEIEHLPVADNSVDAIISNCVINLAPDKRAVFNDAFRVLKPGGRIMVSDIVLERELPGVVRESVGALVGCVAGAMLKEGYLEAIRNAGFEGTKIVEEKTFPIDLVSCDPTGRTIMDSMELPPGEIEEVAGSVRSISVYAYKPKQG
jgi:SAM-dependent methyltransferase